jgi:8-hydroxy-5-deazaflavin:NADPH oxidoreductase
MRIGVLGTGSVGETVASKLADLGHEVRMGAREAGNEKALAWAAGAGDSASEGAFADAAEFGELVVNATAGQHSLAALEQAGQANLGGKVLLDISNPLDFSQGFPPSLTIANTDSLGESIQRANPDAKVVKALNTVTAAVMVDPSSLGERTSLFICGDDAGAKAQVTEILETFGWLSGDIVDLGDISAARGTEAYLLFWIRLMGALDGPNFNIRIVKPEG